MTKKCRLQIIKEHASDFKFTKEKLDKFLLEIKL